LNGGAKSNKCGKISDLPACGTSTSTYRGREQRYLNKQGWNMERSTGLLQGARE
jgi:hypothetical protein